MTSTVLYLSPDNLKAGIEMFLNSIGAVKLSQDVEIKFGDFKGPLGEANIPLHLEISSKEVLEDLSHNATEKKKLS